MILQTENKNRVTCKVELLKAKHLKTGLPSLRFRYFRRNDDGIVEEVWAENETKSDCDLYSEVDDMADRE